MAHRINLKDLERKAWRSVFQDGLWDIYLGLLLLAMAIGTLLSDTSLSKVQQYLIYLGLIVLGMVVLWAGKRFVTVPRMGRVKCGPSGKSRRRKARVLLSISVLVGLMLIVFVWTVAKGGFTDGLPLKLFIPAVWAVNMLLVFGLGAYFLDYDRLYLIAVMYALPVPVDFALDEFAGIKLGFFAFAVPAVVILTMGLIVFVRFLRDHPVLLEETPTTRGTLHGNR